MATSAERQREFRKRMKEKGLVPVTVYVPGGYAGEIMLAAEKLCRDRDLSLGALRNTKTGRLVSIDK